MTRQTELVNTTQSDAPAFSARPADPRLADWLKDYPPSLFSDRLYQSIELMERYSIELAVDLLRRLKAIDHLGEWRSADELCDVLSFQPRFSSALGWLLERLVETGYMEARMERDSRSYHLRRAPWQPELARLRAMGLNIDPANAATLDLLDYTANLYPAVALGEQGGDQGLFGPQGVPLWLNYFHNNNLTYAVNNWLGAVAAADRLSTRTRLRILELGAGAGSASESLLRWFDERGFLPRIERYLITEPNAFFRRRAQRDLSRQYPDLSLEWGALDLNLSWDAQGVGSGEFDLVYAVNVLHISKDLLFSLIQARSALASNGWLVIGECLRPYINQPIYPELMFQILESFTEVQTDPEIRPNPGFLTAADWRRAFTRAGFERVEVTPDIDKIRELYPHFFTGAISGQSTATHNDVG
jgi:SAM-dependent methyltransferase